MHVVRGPRLGLRATARPTRAHSVARREQGGAQTNGGEIRGGQRTTRPTGVDGSQGMTNRSSIVFPGPHGYLCVMGRIFFGLVLALLAAWPVKAGTGRIIKVLPEFLDIQGRTSTSPSLYERDAYQAMLREHPERRSGVRFYVQWKTKGPIWEPVKLRIELRGVAKGNLPQQLVLEEPLLNSGTRLPRWTSAGLEGLTYRQFGAVTAWRATLWEGKRLLSEQKSFLW